MVQPTNLLKDLPSGNPRWFILLKLVMKSIYYLAVHVNLDVYQLIVLELV